MTTAIWFLCDNLEKDPVAPHVANVLLETFDTEPTDMTVDGRPVVLVRVANGAEALLVRTEEVLSHNYPRYLPVMNSHFAEADLACVVNWHAGANVPERIFTAHTAGDVESGTWGTADPRHLRSLLVGLDRCRAAEALEDFSVVVEATHWSGLFHTGDPRMILYYPVPTYDVEIGSEPSSWSSPAAVRTVARALGAALEKRAEEPVTSVLAGGGVQCETGFSDPLLSAPPSRTLALSHVLPNHWLVSGGYDGEDADARLDRCAASINGGVDLIAVHRKLKGSYKDAFRRLGDRLGVPVINHAALKRPEELP